MARKPAKDSVAGKIAASAALDAVWEVPDGLEALTELEEIAWKQYTQAKIGWKSIELRTVHRIVKLESRYQELAGDLADNAQMLAVIKAIETQTRLIGLQTTSSQAVASDDDGRISQGRGKSPIKGKPGLSIIG